MATNLIAGQLATMQQGAEYVGNTVTQARGILTTTNETVNSLMQGWASNAATQFRGIMTQWDQDMANVIAALQRIQEQLDNTRASYNTQQAEELNLTGDFAKTLSGSAPAVPA
jgi:WXG100 family type VII secretion target